MKTLTLLVAVILLMSFSLTADESNNIASGKGVISDSFEFQPKHGYACTVGTGAKKQMWLLLTDQTPPADWTSSKNRVETLRQWCESKKAPFVLVELDSASKPQLLSQCAGDGGLAQEMISTINGLDSVVLKYEINDAKRIKGQLLGGNGNCGDMNYCEQTKDYYFDVALRK
jgi:hypothetical protein